MADETENNAIHFVDRATGERVRENVMGDRFLRLAYSPALRGVCRATVFRLALFSKILGTFCNTRFSRGRIRRTIYDLAIDMHDVDEPRRGFRTFNEFFARPLKPGCRPFDHDPRVFCAPAEGRYFVYTGIEGDTCIPVKGAEFAVHRLLGTGTDGAEAFAGGDVVVSRLCPADYHRFHFPANGTRQETRELRGRYDSVNPVALACSGPVLAENRRTVSMLNLDGFGRVAYVEVGAFGVGAIVQTHTGAAFRKMQEKGYFTFGGSTVVLVVPAGIVDFDKDLIENTRSGIETLVRVGERIGTVARRRKE